MVYFPARKCYHAVKVTFLVLLVVAVLALFEQWRGGKRGTVAFSEPEEYELERQILEDEAKIIPGLGEGGVASYLTGEDKRLGEESEKKLAMNVYLSDRISYNRTLADHRNPACKRVVYDAELPSASVILIFHNEPYSVVVRTIWSVINSCRRTNKWFQQANYRDHNGRTMKLGYPGQDPNSPLVYLKEIILVDDNSTLPELKEKLSHYVRTRLPPDLIRILRLPDRVGLTRARLAGARYAVGDVLVFLDSHCEAQIDWLRPQLQNIKDHPHSVTVPIIDVIDASNFYYSVQDPITFQVGGFTFTGHFTWIDIPEREKKRRGSDIAPTWSPTMAGGLFAINRAYYWELGAYDEQMAGWGGENLEMSFRIWQCGGTLETIPCSRVGHVFRSFHPYGLPEQSDTHGINTARMAEVWMDEYAELFYLHRPDLRNSPKIGDVTHRKILREKLQCKSFQWYLDNIYKEKFVPVRDAYAYGRFQNPASGLCLDTLQREADESALGLYQCHADLQSTQYFILSLDHELRTEDDCAHAQYKRRSSQEGEENGRKVLMSICRGKNIEKKFKYMPSTQQIKHGEDLCLDASGGSGADVLLRHCSNDGTQRWLLDYSEHNNFRSSRDEEPNDQQLKLKRLRKQKRISRSLLSYTNSNHHRNATNRRHTHKKRKKHSRKGGKTKNKFILKLVRTLMNNSDEHLEVDIHCKHRQLFPNNTFVRDLVTILNERNIKVINNGRLFERNKVTQLEGAAGASALPDRVLNKMDISVQEPTPQVAPSKKKLRKKSKPFLQPLVPGGPAPSPAPAPALAPAPPSPAPGPSPPAPLADHTEPRAHRIIIEDFVELAPDNKQKAKRAKKRKRKRTQANPAQNPQLNQNDLMALIAQKLPANVEEQISVPPQSAEHATYADDAAMAMSDNERRAVPADQRWELGESGFRRNSTGWRRRRPRISTARAADVSTGGESDRDTIRDEDLRSHDDAVESEHERSGHEQSEREQSEREHSEREQSEHDHSVDQQSKHERSGHKRSEHGESEFEQSEHELSETSASPVKVVMRSNLTFNLGDEFFHWHARSKNNYEEEGGGAPASSARPPPQVHAWQLAHGGGAHGGGAHGGGHRARPPPDHQVSTSDDDSSNGDSSTSE